MPYPPRTTSFGKIRYAKPTRGEKLVSCECPKPGRLEQTMSILSFAAAARKSGESGVLHRFWVSRNCDGALVPEQFRAAPFLGQQKLRRSAGPGGEKIGLRAVTFDDLPEVFPTQTQVQRELGSDFEVILEIGAVVVAPHVGVSNVGGRNVVGPTHIVGRARNRALNGGQQHLGQSRVAATRGGHFGIDAAIIPCPAALGWLQDRKPEMLKLESDFYRLPSKVLSQIVRELQSVAEFDGRQIIVATNTREALKGNTAESAVVRDLGNALDAELLGNTELVGVGRFPRCGDTVEAQAGFIDQAWRETVSFTQYIVVRKRGLVALRESAPVRNSGEWARKEFRVIDIARAGK